MLQYAQQNQAKKINLGAVTALLIFCLRLLRIQPHAVQQKSRPK